MHQRIIHLFSMDFNPRMCCHKEYDLLGNTTTLFSRQLEEAKRFTRRMGDCFSFETIDMTITHVILPDDDPQMILTLDLLLASIYGW